MGPALVAQRGIRYLQEKKAPDISNKLQCFHLVHGRKKKSHSKIHAMWNCDVLITFLLESFNFF